MKKTMISLICVCTLFVFLSALVVSKRETEIYLYTASMGDITIEDEAVALASSPNASGFMVEENHSVIPLGIKEKKNDKVTIDYSSVSDGYIMINYKNETSKKIKAQVKGPGITYTYNITPLKWEILPLSDGNGDYQVVVFENVKDSKYSVISSVSFLVELKDEFAPFINPNQYVDYLSAVDTVKKAEEITKDIEEPIKKVEKIYDYVVENLTYDNEKAKTVKSGYLPVLDNVLSDKKGICFDYAALMTGMLRSQKVPCKLVVGYAGNIYHAWISVWTLETGWIDGVIYFDGKSWHRMDPTFASGSKKSDAIMEYIENNTNYSAKYFY